MSTHDEDFAAAATEDQFAFFGETVTYYPAAGGSSSPVVICSHRQQIIDGKLVEYEDERLSVVVRRASVTLPKKGDELKRTGDPRTERYGFTGLVIGSTADTWHLEFSRPRAVAIGRPGVRRKV